MEKRTILAIVLSILIFFVFQVINTKMYPVSENVITEDNNTETVISENIENNDKKEKNIIILEDSVDYKDEKIFLKTDIFDISFNTKGGNISSFKLNDYYVDVEQNAKDNINVDLVLQEINNNNLFDIYFGDSVFDEIFFFNKIDDYTYQFSRKFSTKNYNSPITLVKTYKFYPDEYLFDFTISLRSDNNQLLPLNSDSSIYKLNVTKQIGPDFGKLDRREDYRKFSIFNGEKRKELKVKNNELTYIDSYKWAAIEGKFFTLAIIPDNIKPDIYYNTENESDKIKSELVLTRNNVTSSYIEDNYKIYLGPKDKSILEKYNSEKDNKWNIGNLKLDKIINFWFLGMFFMWVLELLNSIINNYGLSIIILTVLIKIVLYPFTKKSFDSMGKMQTIQPEIKKIQDKYKDDPAKLNAATAELYKKEGVNPLGGCLPMLLQMPIFITFYSLFNEYIGLRGSTFIPGWINDLSKPEYIFEFGFNLPILGWDAFRLLPIIYVATQLISMKFTQNQQSGDLQGPVASQQKMLTLGMPIMFFFIMYNQSSGLLLYWITQNIISSAQQISSKKKSDKQHELEIEEKLEKKKNKKGRKQ